MLRLYALIIHTRWQRRCKYCLRSRALENPYVETLHCKVSLFLEVASMPIKPISLFLFGTVLALSIAILVAAGGPARKGSANKADIPRPSVTNPNGLQFADVTQSSGIRFVHNNGAFGRKYLPEALGPGCAFIDYD